MEILVIDGQGGKLGKRLVESIKKSFPQVEVRAASWWRPSLPPARKPG